jgi:hypothetical protein
MESRVALDTDALSKLVATLTSESLAEPDSESVALVRIYFYITTPLVVPTVSGEMDDSEDTTLRTWRNYHFNEVSHPDDFYHGCVKGQSDIYLGYHPDPRDCRVVAEAECGRVEAFLTLKNDVLDALGGKVERIALTKPSDYWQKCHLPPGTPPRTKPETRNPLSKVDWWKW